MDIDLPADRLLAGYLNGFLWADEEWLEVDGASATYWQARLPQTTTVDVLPDGRTKWRIRTRIVEQVPAGTDAHQLCVALNRYAAGWSFAYNVDERTVDAIAAICAPPEWDTFFLRLSEKAKFSAWMSDVLAERLADAVGGVAAFSHPQAQSGVRETFDATYYYLQTLRGRPEWVLDLTRYQFPPVEDTAAKIAEMVGAPDAVWTDEDELRILLAKNLGLRAGFDRHPVFGDGWQSYLIMPPRQISKTVAAHLAAITWALFDDPETNLLGGWILEEDGLAFRQWNGMFEVRNQEQLGSYAGHSSTELWEFTSTLSDALGALDETPLVNDSDAEPDSDAADRAEYIAAAIAEQARPAVVERRIEGEEPADRRLLWLEHRRTLVVAAWFNPMGPTVCSTEICALPDGTTYLVHLRRHPLAPFYSVLGPIDPGVDLEQIHQEANVLLIGDESLPNVFKLWEDPETAATDVPEALRNRVIDVAQRSDRDLIGRAAWISHTMGSPWQFAAVDQSEAKQVAAAASAAASAKPVPDHGFANWWQLVSSFENVAANFRFLPDAWDGTLNTQRVYGNLPQFDPGPLLVTYSNIGMPGPDDEPSDG